MPRIQPVKINRKAVRITNEDWLVYVDDQDTWIATKKQYPQAPDARHLFENQAEALIFADWNDRLWYLGRDYRIACLGKRVALDKRNIIESRA